MRFSRVIVIAGVAALSGCKCGPSISQRVPQLDVLDAQGNARDVVDFGNVQVNTTGTREVRVRNSGTGALNITDVTFSDAHFGLGQSATADLGPGEETNLTLTFTPDVADAPVQGTATIKSNADNAPERQLTVKGTGIVAAAVAQPSPLDFGDVYLGESKTLTLTVTNAGSDVLPVSGATLADADGVTADFSALDAGLAPGTSASVALTWAPTARVALAGTVNISIPPALGTLSVPVTGAGIGAVPKLCFRFDDTGVESCTDGTTGLNVAFGPLCDARVYPEDGGLHCDFDGGSTPAERTGSFYVRNEGNTSVSYSLNITRSSPPVRCDGGAAIDFTYANAPLLADGGAQVSYMVPTVALGPDVSPGVAVRYRATSACRGGDDSDLSTIIWTRQAEPSGTNRQPPVMIASLTGSSLLANPEPYAVTFTGNQPAPQTVNLISNTGGGPLEVTGISLRYAPDGGATPTADCAGVTDAPCVYFAWLDGGATLPLVLEGAHPLPVSKPLRDLAYGTWTVDVTDAGYYVAPTTQQKVWAEVQTSDPYEPVVLVPIIGRYN
jgi:hypothetical protein